MSLGITLPSSLLMLFDKKINDCVPLCCGILNVVCMCLMVVWLEIEDDTTSVDDLMTNNKGSLITYYLL
jgi:hypothetical protein